MKSVGLAKRLFEDRSGSGGPLRMRAKTFSSALAETTATLSKKCVYLSILAFQPAPRREDVDPVQTEHRQPECGLMNLEKRR